eukprot:jgi/Galph1/488/GphlegSOOS_G5266.1
MPCCLFQAASYINVSQERRNTSLFSNKRRIPTPFLSYRRRLLGCRRRRFCSACFSSGEQVVRDTSKLTDSARELAQQLRSLHPERDKQQYQNIRRKLRHISKAIPLQADHHPVSIIEEDNHIIVVNKPSGISMTPKHRFVGGTLLNRLIGYFGYVPHVCHRLDMDTSGVVLFAKHPTSARKIHQQFLTFQIQKLYLAIVHGVPDNECFQVNASIGGDTERKVARKISKDGKTASSCFQVIRSNKDLGYSLILAKPLTGRTHQLRLHLHYVGHPIVFDCLYTGEKYTERIKKFIGNTETVENLKLHAWQLHMKHPISGENRKFEASPDDKFLETLNLLGLELPSKFLDTYTRTLQQH